VQRTAVAEFCIGFGSRAALQERLTNAEALLKLNFNSDQPRDDHGRWSLVGAGSASEETEGEPLSPISIHAGILGPSLAFAGEMSEGAAAGGFLAEGASAVALAALSEFIVPLAAVGGVVVLGYLAIRQLRGLAASGTVKDRPDIKYEYDSDNGYVTLSQSDGSPIFSGTVGDDGFIRDPGGVAIGREIHGAVIINADILPTTDAAAADDANAGALAQTIAVARTNEPQICPNPVDDRKGWKSPRSVQYQEYINLLVNPDAPLTPGTAVRLINPLTGRWVTYDDCYRHIGEMVEAKGPGYGAMFSKNNAKLTAGIDAYLLKQAFRQISASEGRPLEWDFADENAADRARVLFDTHYPGKINVRYIPMPGN